MSGYGCFPEVRPNDGYVLDNESEYGMSGCSMSSMAGLYVGFKRQVIREEVKQWVGDNSILEILFFYT